MVRQRTLQDEETANDQTTFLVVIVVFMLVLGFFMFYLRNKHIKNTPRGQGYELWDRKYEPWNRNCER